MRLISTILLLAGLGLAQDKPKSNLSFDGDTSASMGASKLIVSGSPSASTPIRIWNNAPTETARLTASGKLFISGTTQENARMTLHPNVDNTIYVIKSAKGVPLVECNVTTQSCKIITPKENQ